MRTGAVDQIGNPSSAAGRLASAALTVPLSERLCDVVVVAFALWTVSAHAIVAAGRAVLALLALYAALLAAALLLRRRLGAPAPPPDDDRVHRPLRFAAPVVLDPTGRDPGGGHGGSH